VPTGEDQKQHVELARDVATRFNNLYGDTFVVPAPMMPAVGGRIMSLQNPASKMSKSDADQGGNIMLLEDTASVRKKIQRAVTDSGSTVELTDSKPALANLIQIYAGFSGKSMEAAAEEFAGSGYGDFKTALGNVVVTRLEELQQRYSHIRGNEDALMAVLEAGRVKANAVAEAKLALVKQKVGLL